MSDSLQFNAQEEVDDDDAAAVPRKRGAPWLLGGLVLLLLFIVVAQQALGLWLVVTPDTAFDTLLLYALSSLNFAAFIVFSFIFVRNLLKLRSERRAQQIGSKITTRLVVYFIAVSLLPITAMAAFSFSFSTDRLINGLADCPRKWSARRARPRKEIALFRLKTSARELRWWPRCSEPSPSCCKTTRRLSASWRAAVWRRWKSSHPTAKSKGCCVPI